MAVFWQQIIVFAVVCLAVVYMVVYYICRKRRRASCADCPTLKMLQDQQKVKAK